MAIQVVSANPQASTNMYGTWNNPNANMGLYEAANKPAYLNVLENPYFLQTLASVGESLDPEGVGGALGRTAKGQISSRQAAKANMASVADSNARHRAIIDVLERHGGMTPQGEPGPYSISMGKDNTLTMKLNPDLPAPEVKPPPRAVDRDTQSSVPTAPVQQRSGYDANAPSVMELAPPEAVRRQQLGPVPATSVGPTRSLSYSGPATSVIPFYQAPLRSRRVR